MTSHLATTREIEKIEAASLRTYDELAPEYYTAVHPTSQAFDRTIDKYIIDNPIRLRAGEYYLDVGSGKSKVALMAKGGPSNIVMIDISRKMLFHSRKLSGERLVASAFRLPIRPDTFYGVYSFLGDAFSNSVFLAQAFRVLKKGGEFLLVLPANLWAHTLRNALGIPLESTMFVRGTSRLFSPSFAIPRQMLESEMSKIGFRVIDSIDLCLPSGFPEDQVPEHIILPSKILKVNPYNMPILSLVRASK